MTILQLLGGFSSRATAALSEAWNGPPVLPVEDTAGNEEDYRARYEEVPMTDAGAGAGTTTATVLGEGEFGEVLLIREKILRRAGCSEEDEGPSNGGDNDGYRVTDERSAAPAGRGRLFASKILRKGYSMKHNVVYSPPLPGVLANEVRILRALGGYRYCLRLEGAYEGPRLVYLVTEVSHPSLDLAGYRKRLLGELDGENTVILTEEVVRDVTVRLLSAIDHCANRGIIHRDVKPANVMFVGGRDDGGKEQGQDGNFVDGLRLIDFGSGCLDDIDVVESTTKSKEGLPSDPKKSTTGRHTTMAGSAFYNSPEMFRRSYASKTDVWSAGVTAYVFACGFPDNDRMQKVFDSMHRSPKKGRDLRGGLMPPRKPGGEKVFVAANADTEGNGNDCGGPLPDSFWRMLDDSLLVYWDKNRMSAGEALERCDFFRPGDEEK
uniref:Protein kinase domain-containing protein n=1 Tax=Odontella aurita TaxID=265563 RepID=A0A7S4JBX4_9STRA